MPTNMRWFFGMMSKLNFGERGGAWFGMLALARRFAIKALAFARSTFV